MSLFGALFSGVSGLSAQSQNLGMISDNISNVNTVGHKGTDARFSSMVTRPATASSFSPGGVQSRPAQLVDRQGLMQASQSNTDIGIVGKGFFVVNEAAVPGPGDEFLYTRAGSFKPDSTGALRNSAGYYLQGWATDASGTVTAGNPNVLSSLEPVVVPLMSTSAAATDEIGFGANLPSTAVATDTHTVTVQIFDALGVAHNLDVTFTKTATVNEWEMDVADPTLASTGAASGTTTFNGGTPLTVTFNGDGSLATPASIPDVDLTAMTTGANDQTIELDLGDVGSTNGITQFADQFTINYIDQNGVTVGSVNDVVINEDGLVTALFDNGLSTPIFQVPVATFRNANGLLSRNGNTYSETADSGTVLLNAAGAGPAGSLSPGSLEASTVDVADEFSKMILAQQAFSASARTITVGDEMLTELSQIIR